VLAASKAESLVLGVETIAPGAWEFSSRADEIVWKVGDE
jgi:hypothetical protein